MRPILFVLAGLLLLPAVVHAEPAPSRLVVKTYVAATFVPPETGCTYDGHHVAQGVATPQAAYQQACFDILPSENSFTLHVVDAAPRPVEGWYYVLDAEGRHMDAAVYFCGSATDDLPEGATTLFVVLWGFQFECGPAVRGVQAGVTTVGEVRVAFSAAPAA